MAEEIRATSYVGFDTITQQIEHKLLKRGFQFNVIVVGTCLPVQLHLPILFYYSTICLFLLITSGIGNGAQIQASSRANTTITIFFPARIHKRETATDMNLYLHRPNWIGEVDADQHYLRVALDRLEGAT